MFKIRVMISGDVQGVFFRISTQDKARELELTGWVKNIFNNAVEILAEGDREKLSLFTGWLQLGPPNATIDKISIEWEESSVKEFSSFEINR
ncbi:MAG: acylphosphatase [Candidatus Neomarinimicrobiota bacterium]|nr:acylphosphatase [Candidatus Neomarinimicrobiota bacterium]|tara:strand:- start:3411 stop:3686 length:276 start_codon:yes stop_codon:yes gene_type:complete